VRAVICGLERLDFHHIRSKLTLTFIKNSLRSPNAVVKFLTCLFTLGSQFKSACNCVDVDAASFESLSFHVVKSFVFRHFVNSCNWHYLVLLLTCEMDTTFFATSLVKCVLALDGTGLCRSAVCGE